jgi:MFS family permease
MTLARALKTRRFWLIAIGFYLISVVVGAGTHVLPIILADAGFKAQEGSFVMTIVGVAMMIARFGFGAMLDRFNALRLTSLVFAGAAIGFGCLAYGISAMSVIAAAVLIGLALGAEVDALAYLASGAFGRRHLGAVYGALMFCFSFGLGCGPALFAHVFEHTGSYQGAFRFAVVAAGVATALIRMIRRGELIGTFEDATE